MRTRTAPHATVVAAALVTSLIVTAAPAGAATPASLRFTAAQTSWKTGATTDAAEQGRYWSAARRELALSGTATAHERADLTSLIGVPETDTTAAQRATATRVVRELDGFFRTPGLYGVAAGNPRLIARADWIKSGQVAAATSNDWLGAAVDELSAYGTRYVFVRAELVSLEAIPLTSTTAKQRATASRDVRGLDTFFQTPGLNF